MRQMKMSMVLRQTRDGNFECLTDLKLGYVHVRWYMGKRETLEVVEG